MANYAIMLVVCVLVCGTMVWVLLWFFRRLRKIEEKEWGEQPKVSGKALLKKFLFWR